MPSALFIVTTAYGSRALTSTFARLRMWNWCRQLAAVRRPVAPMSEDEVTTLVAGMIQAYVDSRPLVTEILATQNGN